MTDREAFTRWWNEIKGDEVPVIEFDSFSEAVMFCAWQAATLAERERCAKLCLESKVDMAHWVGNDIAEKIRGE